jgi:2-keto-4-pentenoate hydratase/2-oxohepta-3-ene-1,7-dioic acid hydratase in catechol pathway
VKICWFDDHRLGLVEDGQVFDVSPVLEMLEQPRYPRGRGDLLIANLERLRPLIAQAARQARGAPIDTVRFLSPVAQPTKIIGVPVNYLKHAQEAIDQIEVFTKRHQGSIREQGLFLKANSALVGPGEGVKLRLPDRRSDHEMELGVIIGKQGSDIPESEALSHVAGYAIALDMVVRGSEDRSFRKSIDTYAVLGPWMVTADEIADPAKLNLRLAVNGEVRQSSNTGLMILNIQEQIAWASQFYTLYPGDIIMTGTCEGVSQVRPGDVMQCSLDGVGEMTVAIS